jgi:hypothetical protein
MVVAPDTGSAAVSEANISKVVTKVVFDGVGYPVSSL